MKIVVVGGSGLIGSKLVPMLTSDGHEVVAASRRSGVDTVTGADRSPQPPVVAGPRSAQAPLKANEFLLRGPAKDPLKAYAVTVDGEVGRVEAPLARAVQGA